ncbi:unnamed protein product, partial [Polarella glacialis]
VARVREFAMPAEDWMSVSVLRPEAAARFLRGAGLGGAAGGADAEGPVTPRAPEELVQLQWESDRIRAQATRAGGTSVSFTEWAAYSEKMIERMAVYNIV